MVAAVVAAVVDEMVVGEVVVRKYKHLGIEPSHAGLILRKCVVRGVHEVRLCSCDVVSL